MKPAPIDPPQIHDRLWHGFSGVMGWDIGVNAGYTSAHMLTVFERVVGLEPAEECWETLDAFAADNPRFTLVKAAVSDSFGYVNLTVLPDKIDTGQLVTSDCHGMEWDVDQAAAHLRKVPCLTLDNLWEKFGTPDFIKIDVEGHDFQVLAGGAQLLASEGPELLVEFHSPELYTACVELLKDTGYHVETVRHPHYPEGSQFWHQHGWLRATLSDR